MLDIEPKRLRSPVPMSTLELGIVYDDEDDNDGVDESIVGARTTTVDIDATAATAAWHPTNHSPIRCTLYYRTHTHTLTRNYTHCVDPPFTRLPFTAFSISDTIGVPRLRDCAHLLPSSILTLPPGRADASKPPRQPQKTAYVSV